ncbi:MAG: flagellar basal body L-ring protein FlgH [Candidatus Saganbacteria bacterium]|nr:flagellar basal body L-ring protein FlgH [Candidatus Saganbacteria bacterium]
MKRTVAGATVLIMMVLAGSPAMADSVWDEKNSSSPYSTEKAHRVGDIINIVILESTSAVNQAGTDTDVSDDLSAKFTHTIDQLAPVIGPDNQLTGQAANKYTGTGKTTRASNVTARIAAWVTEVKPNGNLAIEGKHRVQVNDEIQEITITGTVRPKDISGGNSVYSYQVANADLTVRGTGVVAESESPGWFTRILNWLF